VKHLSALQLCVFLDDALAGAPDEQTARHIATCAMCHGRYEAWCHVDDSLRELLGQLPDEYAMEQRTSWVEIAVAAERKGLPAPEFTELRIPLEQPPPAMPGLHMFPPVSLPSPLFAPPPAPARSTPQAAAPPAPVVSAPPPRSREVSRPPAPSPPPPAAPAPQPEVARRAGESGVHAYAAAPTSVAAALPSSPSSSPSAKAEPAAADAPAGYARLPRSPRKGITGFLTRPGLWLVLMLVAGLVAGVPAGIRRYGIPELKIDFRDPKQRTSDVRKAEADADGDREPDAATTRPHGSSRQSPTRAKAGKEDPDASILFDLPALEPEDGEPDPATEASPKHTGPASSRVLVSHYSTICGEVRNSQGTPIEGAHVTLSSPLRVVRTDRHGRFCVTCPPGEHTIHIEAPGRAPVTRALKVGRERLETRFTLDAAN
jgi:hypothetical protein